MHSSSLSLSLSLPPVAPALPAGAITLGRAAARRPSGRGLGERPQLLRVGHRVAAQLAVGPDLVGAHPPQRRRVGVDAHGRPRAPVAHAVDVGGGEAERAAGAEAPGRGRAPEQQAVLDHLALRDGHGAGGAVVVVEAGVVVLHPADEPDGDVVVADELLVDALGRVVPDERAPQVGPFGEPGDEVLELWALQVAPERPRDHAGTSSAAGAPASSRAGLALVSAWSPAGPSRWTGGLPTTGRSEPWTIWSTPTTPPTASIAR